MGLTAGQKASKTRKRNLAVEKMVKTKMKKKIQALKEDLNRLRGEIEYKNKQLAEKEMEMESYKKVSEEKIFQLAARVKELEAKAGESSITS